MKWLKRIVLALLALFVVIQVVRPSRENPPVDPAQTIFATGKVPADIHAIIDRSCNDCHTNTVKWPWYSNVAPMSWLVAHDVKEGREELNFSTWAAYAPRRQAHKLEELCEQVNEGKMPLSNYVAIHGEAKLSPADRNRVCEWANALRAEIIAAHPEAAQSGGRGEGGGQGRGRGRGRG